MMWWLLSTLTYVFASDGIKHLPGLNYNINFNQYSGYLDASPTRKIHYWFVESQNDPRTDPLIVWFNGGPGCSSLFGMLQELGPFLVQADGKTLQKNEYSWNNNASVLFIESPAGVGFSYSTDGNITTSDELASLHNYQVIKHFLEKYPQFRQNDMFITGESYAGIYVPTLAVRIIDGQNDFDINLKGIAIGNGYMSVKLNRKTEGQYLYYHGVIDEERMERRANCCEDYNDGGECDWTCYVGLSVAVDSYDLHSKCSLDDEETFQQMFEFTNTRKSILKYNTMMFAQKQDSTSNIVTSNECVPISSLYEYLNLPEVQKALHISSKSQQWNRCNKEVRHNYKKHDLEQFNNVRKIVENKVRALLYYGDSDSMCNFIMGQKFSAQLGIKKVANKTAWFYDNKIVGGYKTVYENLTFLTINGAGHMVPRTHPRQIQHVLQHFINGETI